MRDETEPETSDMPSSSSPTTLWLLGPTPPPAPPPPTPASNDLMDELTELSRRRPDLERWIPEPPLRECICGLRIPPPMSMPPYIISVWIDLFMYSSVSAERSPASRMSLMICSRAALFRLIPPLAPPAISWSMSADLSLRIVSIMTRFCSESRAAAARCASDPAPPRWSSSPESDGERLRSANSSSSSATTSCAVLIMSSHTDGITTVAARWPGRRSNGECARLEYGSGEPLRGDERWLPERELPAAASSVDAVAAAVLTAAAAPTGPASCRCVVTVLGGGNILDPWSVGTIEKISILRGSPARRWLPCGITRHWVRTSTSSRSIVRVEMRISPPLAACESAAEILVTRPWYTAVLPSVLTITCPQSMPTASRIPA
eukprot:comp22005_c0_seq1/m.50526 comp22005_c0_seq1/g.50526  ORF comp22005_c0_seq1/g.50526 comp22005_c0_seq1/m.50526 type:complete len:377 (+) comp22005_c0_seq1:635-1765(+)